MSENELQALPNVGPAVAAMLVRLGIERPADLTGHAAEELYDRLCEQDGRRHDPCLLDTFVAVIDYTNGAPARPWWHDTRLRTNDTRLRTNDTRLRTNAGAVS